MADVRTNSTTNVSVHDEAGNPIAINSGRLQVDVVSGGGGTPPLYTERIEESGSDMYVGSAAPGSSTSSPVWRIKKIVEVGSMITITWANGDSNFTNIWDDRTTLTYN